MLLKKGNPRTVFRAALGCLLVFSLLPLVTRHAGSQWIDVIDGVRGVLLGAMIALIAVSGVLQRRGTMGR